MIEQESSLIRYRGWDWSSCRWDANCEPLFGMRTYIYKTYAKKSNAFCTRFRHSSLVGVCIQKENVTGTGAFAVCSVYFCVKRETVDPFPSKLYLRWKGMTEHGVSVHVKSRRNRVRGKQNNLFRLDHIVTVIWQHETIYSQPLQFRYFLTILVEITGSRESWCQQRGLIRSHGAVAVYDVVAVVFTLFGCSSVWWHALHAYERRCSQCVQRKR